MRFSHPHFSFFVKFSSWCSAPDSFAVRVTKNEPMGDDPFISAGSEQTGSAMAVHVLLPWVVSPPYKAYPVL